MRDAIRMQLLSFNLYPTILQFKPNYFIAAIR